jgi:hypothetical protein
VPGLQDALVALIAVVAGLWIARRRFGFGRRALVADGCEKCASGDPCASETTPASRPVSTHPLKLVRAPRR